MEGEQEMEGGNEEEKRGKVKGFFLLFFLEQHNKSNEQKTKKDPERGWEKIVRRIKEKG